MACGPRARTSSRSKAQESQPVSGTAATSEDQKVTIDAAVAAALAAKEADLKARQDTAIEKAVESGRLEGTMKLRLKDTQLVRAQNRVKELEKQIEELKKPVSTVNAPVGTGFKIAYFVMDSLMTQYEGFKEAQAKVKAKENDMQMQLSSLDRSNQKKVEVWRQKGNTMTQAETEQAQLEYQKMQQEFQSRKQALEQDVYKYTEDRKADIRKNIEDYLKDYNKEKNYSYIFSYDVGSFIYNKDTTYNITQDLIEGLNASYKKK